MNNVEVAISVILVFIAVLIILFLDRSLYINILKGKKFMKLVEGLAAKKSPFRKVGLYDFNFRNSKATLEVAQTVWSREEWIMCFGLKILTITLFFGDKYKSDRPGFYAHRYKINYEDGYALTCYRFFYSPPTYDRITKDLDRIVKYLDENDRNYAELL